MDKLGVTSGPRDLLDTNMLVSATRKSRVGVITQHKDPMRGGWRCGGI